MTKTLGRKPKITKDFLQKEYVEKLRTRFEIAKELNCRVVSVTTAIRKFGFILHDMNVVRFELSKDFIYENYVRLGKSCSQIAREIGCSFSTIIHNVKKFGFEIRKHGHDLTGKKFGYLEVLYRDKSKTGDTSYWICKCVCGGEPSIRTLSLVDGETKSCGCKNPRNILTKEFLIEYYINLSKSVEEISKEVNCSGRTVLDTLHKFNFAIETQTIRQDKRLFNTKFGKLTTVSISDKSVKNSVYWNCVCDCTGTIEVSSSRLRNGLTTHCGCEKKYNNRSKFVGEIGGTKWTTIKHGAIDRDIEFSITKEYAWELFLKQDRRCVLSNQILNLPTKYHQNKPVESNASLDRIDSSKGYVEGNVQWVDKHINKMKWSLPSKPFVNFCFLITNPISPYKKYKIKIPNIILSRWMSRIKSFRLGYSIDKKYIMEIAKKQNYRCSMTGLQLIFDSKNKTASIDRIDSLKGYVKGNIQIVHKCVNFMKLNYDINFFKEVCKKISDFQQTKKYWG